LSWAFLKQAKLLKVNVNDAGGNESTLGKHARWQPQTQSPYYHFIDADNDGSILERRSWHGHGYQ